MNRPPLPITNLSLRVVFNSRGQETVEADVKINGAMGRAAAPAGASAGKFEAVALPAGGVKEAVQRFHQYAPRLIGVNAADPQELAGRLREIDGSGNYSWMGGSVAYAVTVAAAEAAARVLGVELYEFLWGRSEYRMPYPLGNVLGGGRHAGEGSPDIQEFLVCPVGADNIFDALRANVLVHREVRREIERRDPQFSGGKGDEGAWAPRASDEEALEMVATALERVEGEVGFTLKMGLDLAASTLWDPEAGVYNYRRQGVRRTPGEQIDYVRGLAERYPLIYIEDPLDEEDFAGFGELTSRVRDLYLVGDDLFVTNVERLRKGAAAKSGNAAILKVNQVGTLGEALEFAAEAERLGYRVITSHRSGDTPDPHIAHVAIATGSIMLKSGVVGGERVAKLNELLRVDESYRARFGVSMPMVRLEV
jgi:enolase